MSAELSPTPEMPESNNETQYSELFYSVPEVIDFARRLGDEGLATEFEAYMRWHENHNVQVKVLLPNTDQLAPIYELVFPEEESQ